ncbi:hypothetical protein Tco_1069207 [Tanacetum coccineum]|uniref:Integrase catalytic domain-containing protein n=1 Tax=Tanacetum coccineum TaxID=301880 RepID=A0ABQ5HIA9_9ASTR
MSDNPLNKTKQIWKPKGRLSDNEFAQDQAGRTGHALVSGLRLFKTYDGESLLAYFIKVCPRTPQQNGVVERRNRNTGEAATYNDDILESSHVSMAEAVLPEYLVLCADPTNDSRKSRKISAKADMGFHWTDTEGWRCYFQPCYDEQTFETIIGVNEPVSSATEINAQVVPPGTSLSTTIAQDAPSTSASSTTSDIHPPVQHQEIAEEPTHEDTPINHDVLHPSHNLVTGDPGSAQSSSGNVNSAEPIQVNNPPDHLKDWTKDHPLDNIVGNPLRPVIYQKNS